MNRIRPIICAAIAVAAIAIGYLLPETVLSLKDSQIMEETTTYASTPVHFFSSRQISDTLKLLPGEYDTQAILPSYASMSEEQVYEAAEEFLLNGANLNLFEQDISALQRYTISPSLVYISDMDITASEDQSTIKPLVSSRLSAIIWNCSFTDGNAVSVECTTECSRSGNFS